MISAIRAIGRGEEAYEGVAFDWKRCDRDKRSSGPIATVQFLGAYTKSAPICSEGRSQAGAIDPRPVSCAFSSSIPIPPAPP
jgi:hypothetical protein